MIDVITLDSLFPLIVDAHDPTKFFKPNDGTGIRIATSDLVRLACPGDENFIKSTPEKHQYQNFVCNFDGSLVDCDNDASSYKPANFRCNKVPSSIVRRTEATEDNLRPGEDKLEIGFRTSDADFLPIIQIYQDSKSLSTYYAKSEVWPTLSLKPKFNFLHQSFDSELYHQDLNLDEIYDGRKQTNYFNHLLGYSTNWIRQSDYKHYCKRFDNSFLNRGHLTPKGSFLYYAAAKASFKYVNVQPQWKAINNEMWSNIEIFINHLAESLQSDLKVYTGVHGQIELKTSEGEMKSIFLSSDNRISVPLYFWKIVVDERSGRGIVYVTLNSPFCKVEDVEYLCQDRNPGPTNMKRPLNWGAKHCKFECGYSYWCKVDDFLQTSGIVVHGLELPLDGLLYDEKS